jgi:hypothetical protein
MPYAHLILHTDEYDLDTDIYDHCHMSACAYMRLYLYVSPSISNSYVHVCLVFACDIHAHTGIYALVWEFRFACICLYCEKYMHIFMI